MRITKRLVVLLVALGAALALSISPASAKYGGGGGGGGGGAPGETTVSNNLSVPAVFVGSVGFGLTSPTLRMPTGLPSTGWENDPTGYYFVQGVNTWQAEYVAQATDTATGKWGDNLSGDAKLKVGSPVRVEMGLTSDTVATLQGFNVIKLEDSKLDRESAYGTKAILSDTAYVGNPLVMPARVWTNGAVLVITGPSGVTASMPGEINATGAVVFGYNWRPKAAGIYTLTFTVPSTSGVTISNPADMVKIVTVLASGGGGGGHRK